MREGAPLRLGDEVRGFGRGDEVGGGLWAGEEEGRWAQAKQRHSRLNRSEGGPLGFAFELADQECIKL